MTQEELDALVNAGADSTSTDSAENTELDSASSKEQSNLSDDNFRVEASKEWPPPPPNKDHKVVHQLDDVTRDTEAKAGEVFDQLDIIGANADDVAKAAKSLKEYLAKQEEMFVKLTAKFPNVKAFAESCEQTKTAKESVAKIIDGANACSDAMLQAMDIMQFQDINRQRIERVINVMRALAQYMNSLFESKIDDSKRVSSAVYIQGDDNADVANAEEIESLIASFGAKS